MNKRCVVLEVACKKVAEDEQVEVRFVAIQGIGARSLLVIIIMQRKRIYVTIDKKENDGDILSD